MKTAHDIYLAGARLAEQADIARVKRLPVDYKALYGKASVLEYQSAEMMKKAGHSLSNRITRLRSAAALAYKAGNFPEAQRIIAIARSEQPDGYESIKLDDIEAAIQRESNGQVQVTGALTAADADASQISIRELETSKVYAFTVPEKMFRRVVKKHWLDVVRAIGNASPQGMLTLEKISPA